MSSSCFVTTIDLSVAKKLGADLESQGFILQKGPYMIFQAKKPGICCTLYESGKLTVQGKAKDDFILYYLEPEVLKTFSYRNLAAKKPTEVSEKAHLDYASRIGIDEAGKGDVFGPLCICALYGANHQIDQLAKLGVSDSKKISDKKIVQYASKIKKFCPYHIVKLFPNTYNRLYSQFHNLNTLLAWGHATALEELFGQLNAQQDVQKVIIDQFGPKSLVASAVAKKNITLPLDQRHRGEDDLVVAGASILARDAFIHSIDVLSKQYGLFLPKGASPNVKKALEEFIRSHGEKELFSVAKLHFKTVGQVTGQIAG